MSSSTTSENLLVTCIRTRPEAVCLVALWVSTCSRVLSTNDSWTDSRRICHAHAIVTGPCVRWDNGLWVMVNESWVRWNNELRVEGKMEQWLSWVAGQLVMGQMGQWDNGLWVIGQWVMGQMEQWVSGHGQMEQCVLWVVGQLVVRQKGQWDNLLWVMGQWVRGQIKQLIVGHGSNGTMSVVGRGPVGHGSKGTMGQRVVGHGSVGHGSNETMSCGSWVSESRVKWATKFRLVKWVTARFVSGLLIHCSALVYSLLPLRLRNYCPLTTAQKSSTSANYLRCWVLSKHLNELSHAAL